MTRSRHMALLLLLLSPTGCLTSSMWNHIGYRPMQVVTAMAGPNALTAEILYGNGKVYETIFPRPPQFVDGEGQVGKVLRSTHEPPKIPYCVDVLRTPDDPPMKAEVERPHLRVSLPQGEALYALPVVGRGEDPMSVPAVIATPVTAAFDVTVGAACGLVVLLFAFAFHDDDDDDCKTSDDGSWRAQGVQPGLGHYPVGQ